MKQTITVQVEIEFEGKYCLDDCMFIQKIYGLLTPFCKLFNTDVYWNNDYCKVFRCSQCIDACKENKE